MAARGEARPSWPRVTRWLFRYVLAVVALAFCNRSMPVGFLALSLRSRFGLGGVMIGVVMAAYPASAMLASPWATRTAIASHRILQLHTFAFLAMSGSTALFACSEGLRELLGPVPGTACVILLRTLQGTTAALYLASNTTLITRFFPEDVPYVVGMVEVGVGVGSQLGRLFGGMMYDQGGFACPFLTLAMLQMIVSLVGFGFQEACQVGAVAAGSRCVVAKPAAEVSWRALLTPRTCAALYAVLMDFLLTSFMDAMLPQYLEDHLGPISVSLVSALMSLRSISYLFFSYACAQVMHRKLLSFERLLTLGAFGCMLGLVLMAPLGPVRELMERLAAPGKPPALAFWAVQLACLAVSPAGLAALFIPALPLMQSEARHLGSKAVEETAQLFIIAMSAGEASGPILGGEVVSLVGFPTATFLFVLAFVPVVAVLLVTYDPQVVRARHGDEEDSGLAAAMEVLPGGGGGPALADFVDGDSAYRWRRLPFALQQELAPPGSAPSLAWRRPYHAQQAQRPKPWSTAPPSTRRAYEPPSRRPSAPLAGWLQAPWEEESPRRAPSKLLDLESRSRSKTRA